MTTTAIILAGHGSRTGSGMEMVWQYVYQLRTMNAADEVTACFKSGNPGFGEVLDTVQADEIIVVPLFMSRGYHTNTLIPAEMGLDGLRTERNSQVMYYARTIGEHQKLSQIMQKRIDQTIETYNLSREQVAAAVIGHGTRRNPESRLTTQQQTEFLQQQKQVKEVFTVFLEDDPAIPEIHNLTEAPVIIAVPFFLTHGVHVTIDIPRELDLVSSGVHIPPLYREVKGRQVYYTAPMGTDALICELILDLVNETGSS